MFDLFVLDKFKTQATTLSDSIKNDNMEQINFNFILTIRETMSVEVASVVFSNHHLRDKLSFWYILRLDRDKIELLEIRDEDHSNVLLYFQSNKIYFNGNEADDLLRKDFKKRIRSILIDVRKDKCKVFEEKI